MQAGDLSISVVMPVFNRRTTVGRAIESVLAQTFRTFELIVVDDGSSDGTPDVVSGYADGRVRLLRQPCNKGGNAARNAGIRAARGEVVCFLDSDDEFLPHKLAHIEATFRSDPRLEMLIDSYELVASDRTTVRNNPILTDSRSVEAAIFSRRVYKSTPAFSVRRQALLRVGLFDETLRRRQDMDLALRLVRAARCATTDAVLWRKHWSAASISAQQETFMQAMLDMCDRHPEYLSDWKFKNGLARDFARHFIRLAWGGKFATVSRDVRRFAASDYRSHAPSLVAVGLLETTMRPLHRAPSMLYRLLGSRQARERAGRLLQRAEAARRGAE